MPSTKWCDFCYVQVHLIVDEKQSYTHEPFRVALPTTNDIGAAIDTYLELRRRQKAGERFAGLAISFVELTLWSNNGKVEETRSGEAGTLSRQQPELPFGSGSAGEVADSV